MAKYKLLKDITVYNYKWDGGYKPTPTTVRFIIPAGTIFESNAPGYTAPSATYCAQYPSHERCAPGYVPPLYIGNIETKYGRTDYEVDPSLVELVPDSTPVTLEANVIAKDVSSTEFKPFSNNGNSKTFFTPKNIIIGIVIIGIIIIAFKLLKK